MGDDYGKDVPANGNRSFIVKRGSSVKTDGVGICCRESLGLVEQRPHCGSRGTGYVTPTRGADGQ